MLLLWLPAAWTSFWGDDSCLSGVRLVSDAGVPWIATAVLTLALMALMAGLAMFAGRQSEAGAEPRPGLRGSGGGLAPAAQPGHGCTRAGYAYAFGSNLERNAASACAWLMSVRREALDMLATGATAAGAAWVAATALPMLLVLRLAIRGGVSRLTSRQWLLLPAVIAIAYAPYLPLQWNSYAYYAAVAAIFRAIALARLLAGRRVAPVVAVLLAVSSQLAVEGILRLAHPELFGRARWAEFTLRELERACRRARRCRWWSRTASASTRSAHTDSRGTCAWRPEMVQLVATCPEEGRCLQIRADGSWRLE